jgi:hypothetical protein
LDFPPGDVYSPTVENDTADPVFITTCHDSCARGDTGRVEVPAGSRSTRFNVDARGGTGLLVQDASSLSPLGCLTPDADALGNVDRHRVLKVSAAGSCVGSVPNPSAPLLSEAGLGVWLVGAVIFMPLLLLLRRRRRSAITVF